MKTDGSSPVDHHIQAFVVKRLFASSEPISFSDLKPGDIENSLFAYHMHKLERRGVISKMGDGYVLTPTGVRWVNFTSPRTLKSQQVPRVLLNFVVFSPDKQRVILARRTSRAAEYMGEYLFPSGFQPYGMPIEQAANVVIEEKIGSVPEGLRYFGVCEIVHDNPDAENNHWVLPTFVGTSEQVDFPLDDFYTQQWVAVRDVIDHPETYLYPIGAIIQRCLDDEPFTYDTFVR